MMTTVNILVKHHFKNNCRFFICAEDSGKPYFLPSPPGYSAKCRRAPIFDLLGRPDPKESILTSALKTVFGSAYQDNCPNCPSWRI
jgi:hypothetical protein